MKSLYVKYFFTKVTAIVLNAVKQYSNASNFDKTFRLSLKIYVNLVTK